MSYQVIARKYRPKRFADITAQEHITRTIQNSLRFGRVGHGYIFSGLRGVGKTTAARVFAKAVNCSRMIEDPLYLKEVTEPCGECESCHDFEQGTSLNISEFDAASNNSVDDIRLLRENVRYGPQKGRYRVYIIDEVHMLSTAAFNAFLKTLEEPPAHAIFIFATTELHKIPPTIASRCQRFNFKRIPLAEIEKQLRGICEAEKIDVSGDALQLIGRKAQGSMRDAQSILDQVIAFAIEQDDERSIHYDKVAELLNYIDDDQLFDVTDAVAEGDPAKMLGVARFVIDNGYDEQDFLEKLIEHLRNFLVVYNLRSTRLIERPESVKERYQRDASRFTSPVIMQMIDLLLQAQKELKFQFEYQFRFELVLFKLIEIACPVKPVSATAPSEGGAKKKVPDRTIKTATSSSEGIEPAKVSLQASVPVLSPSPDLPAPVDFSSWQDKFSKFAKSEKRRFVPSVPGISRDRQDVSQPFDGVAEVQKFRVEWKQFLDVLLKKNYKVIVTHLRSCELASFSHGILHMNCSKKFSYEELLHDAGLLSRELEDFYGLPVKLHISYDEEKDTGKEQTIFTLFRELAESNEVVKFLVREFGGELVY